MTWMFIDESGDLGASGSKHIVLAAVITSRRRDLLQNSKKLPSKAGGKFYGSTEDERRAILDELAVSNSFIVHVCVEKTGPLARDFHGNRLYAKMFEELLLTAFPLLRRKDVNIFIDRSSFISKEDFEEISERTARDCGKNLKKCGKVVSNDNNCIKIADQVAGSIRWSYEREDDRYIEIIKDKMSAARKY